VSEFVQSTSATKESVGAEIVCHDLRRRHSGKKSVSVSGSAARWEDLPGHSFAKESSAGEGQHWERVAQSYWDRDPDLWMYRRKTTTLLRRYMQWSLEAGRLPSLLGRELFRAKSSVHAVVTFEDRVIFIHDMERCLERLAGFDREIIARVVLQEHEHWQAAKLLQCTRKTIARRLPEVLDELSEALLKARLLTPLPEAPTEAL
jgi:DNA-directed RNA polymerase specialized sigma24 family protein